MQKPFLSIIAASAVIATLGADELLLEPIVVSATKTEQPLKEITSDVQVITSEDLEEKHVASVIDALRLITGLPVTQYGGPGQLSSFFQRGFGSENTVVLIDGIRYNDPTTTKGQAQLEHLMINDIERIEILNGAQSGVWGANAVAGVINIITKQASNTLRIGGNIEYGSYETSAIAVNASRKQGAFSYYIGANQFKTDGFSAMAPIHTDPKDYESDGYTNQTFNAKLGYDLTPSDSIRTQLTFIDAKTQYDAWDEPDSSANEIHQINRLGNIGYRHAFSNNDYIDLSYALSEFHKKDPLGWTTAFRGKNKEFNLQGTYHYGFNGFVVAGFNTLDSEDTLNDKQLDSHGAFLTNTNRIGQLILTESLRYDAYDEFKNKTTGKIGMKYFITDDFTLSSNYGTAYRTPSLYELYDAWSGNSELRPETTKSFDASVRYKHLGLTYYNSTVDNLIEYTSSYTYENVAGKSTFEGYEIRYDDTISDYLSLGLSYNRLWAKDKDGIALQRRPYDNAKVSLTYYPAERFSLTTTANYIGTRYNDLAHTVQTGRYTLWSAAANYDLSRTLTVYARGENLTDKLYQEVAGYGSAGRSVHIGINARF